MPEEKDLQVRVKKKDSIWKKFKETFFSTDSGSVLDYVIFDVVTPAIKETIANMIQGSTNMFLFGDRGRYGGRYGYSRRDDPPWDRGYTSYDRYGRSDGYSRNSTPNNVMAELEFGSRDKAQQIINEMVDWVRRYGKVSVKQTYKFAEVNTDWTKDRWGWDRLSDVEDARPVRTEDGWYVIDICRPVELKD